MKHTTVAIALAAALALPQAALVQAASAPATTPQTQSQAMTGYLGIGIRQVPDALRAQLASTIPSQQGVLVTQVMSDSPAEKAGIKAFDILLRFDDQKLFSPEQLTRLISSDTSGQPVKLTLVRAGDVSTRDVTLGEHQKPESQFLQPLSFDEQHHPFFEGSPNLTSSEANWQSFDILSLDKLKDGKYKATIGYLADDGSHKRLEFTGTRDQIRKEILAQKDLPNRERDQLLGALASRDNLFPAQAYAWPYAPFVQNFPLASPWWGWHPVF